MTADIAIVIVMKYKKKLSFPRGNPEKLCTSFGQ